MEMMEKAEEAAEQEEQEGWRISRRIRGGNDDQPQNAFEEERKRGKRAKCTESSDHQPSGTERHGWTEPYKAIVIGQKQAAFGLLTRSFKTLQMPAVTEIYEGEPKAFERVVEMTEHEAKEMQPRCSSQARSHRKQKTACTKLNFQSQKTTRERIDEPQNDVRPDDYRRLVDCKHEARRENDRFTHGRRARG